MRVWITIVLLGVATSDALAALPDFFEVEMGWMSGMTVDDDGTTRAYLGIPYALPPLGELRWRPPQPPAGWDALYEAIEYGPACPQPLRDARALVANLNEEQDEDCLYLNVWSAAATAEEKRAVMVWIHGGGFIRGSGAQDAYDGAALARKGVVVVTINYRLGVFGFLAHPALTAESEHGASGNYALMDQIAALQWVQRNIDKFGGDPDNVTVFGESAGAISVAALIATPSARGLFVRAIAQSGHLLMPLATLADASQKGSALIEKTGARDLDAMRALDTEALLDAAGTSTVFPHVDGWVLTERDVDRIASGRQADIPLLIGSTADEATMLAGSDVPDSWDAFTADSRRRHGERADRFLELFPADSDGGPRDPFLHSWRDFFVTCRVERWAKASSTAYLYYFTRVPPNEQSGRYGAFHTAEIQYAFDNLDARLYSIPMEYGDTDRALAQTMSSYWVNFAKTGDPNGDGLPNWPVYDADGSYLELGDEVRAGTHLRRAACEFFEAAR